MDALDFISKVFFCLTQNESIEFRLKSALNLIHQFFALDTATILFIPEQRHDFQVISCGGKPALIDEYKEKYFYLDPYHGFGDDQITLYRPGLDNGNATEEFRRFCADELNLGVIAGADFQLNQSMEIRLRFCRSAQQPDFTPAEIKLLNKVLPPLRNAIEQTVHNQCHSLFDTSAHKVLARLRIGIVVVNKSLEVIDKSCFADELLVKSGVLICNKNRLMAKSKDYQSRIEAMVQELAGNEDILYRTLYLPTSRCNEAYTLAITRDDGSAHEVLFGEQRYTIYIFSSLEDNVDMSLLVKLWNISPAEQRILSAIMRFDNVKKVALELHISPNTAKAQLKSVYRKLGIVSKTMLIKRLNSVRNMTALLG